MFPGVDRTLVLLDGAGMALSFAGVPTDVVLDQRRQPFAFPGEAEIQCRLLGGPVRDFNLMVDRATAEATLTVVHLAPGETRTLAGAGSVFLHGLEGQASVAGTPLAEEETLWLEAPEAVAPAERRGRRRDRHPPEPPDGAVGPSKSSPWAVQQGPVRLLPLGQLGLGTVYELIIANGLFFDGRGSPPRVRHLGIRDGLVTTIIESPLLPGPTRASSTPPAGG